MDDPKTQWLAAMVAVQQQVRLPADSDGRGAGGAQYQYLSLAGAINVLRPAMTSHGLAVWWSASSDDADRMIMSCHVGHRGGHVETSTVVMPACWLAQPKSGQPLTGSPAVQSMGAANTYLRRYSLLSAMGMVVDEDLDGATPGPSPAPVAQSAPPAPPTTAVGSGDHVISADSLASLRGIAGRCQPAAMNAVIKRVQDVYHVPMNELMESEARTVYQWFLDAVETGHA